MFIKGLGAPIGSVLVASSEIIAKARRIRKMLGGGMRQAAMLAAAGIYALDNHLHRLDDDHNVAQLLAQRQPQLINFLADKNIIISHGNVIRLVTYLDINSTDIVKVVTAVEEFYNNNH